jgi:hypothetical protein
MVVKKYLKLESLKRLAQLYSIHTLDIRNWTLGLSAHDLLQHIFNIAALSSITIWQHF